MKQLLEALDLALEALEELQPDDAYPYSLQSKAITAIKQARAKDALYKLAEESCTSGLRLDDWDKIGCVNHDCDKCKAVQEPVIKQGWDVDTLLDKPAAPVQEPVAYRSRLASGSYTYCNTPQFSDNAEPLYTAAPVQQKPLFADIIAQHPGLAEELKAMDEGFELGYKAGLAAAHPAPVQSAEREEPVAWIFKPNRELLWPNEVERKNPLELNEYAPLYITPPAAHPDMAWIERERAVGYREGHMAALAQRQWVGLTDEERMDILLNLNWDKKLSHMDTALAIEAKLKEKNT